MTLKKESIAAVNAPRGTRDIMGSEKQKHDMVIGQAWQIANSYNFQAIETPIFEHTGVFHRLGESSDIVTKETYTFDDRGGNSLTLRPEGTASVVRALISNGKTQDLPGKYFYAGPMFRYERPQKGRYRQFTQIGVELIGRDGYHGDVEVIMMAHQLLNDLGIQDITLKLNSLGDQDSRDNYRSALISYFQSYEDQLSPDSKRRLVQNPLRILDSKDPSDRELIEGAPRLSEYLSETAKTFFDNVCTSLDSLDIAFEHDTTLVRGLDYYCHTAFEFVSNQLGAQGTVLAGGRYDGLVKNLGGPDLSGVGFAAGVDRLAMLANVPSQDSKLICFLPLGEQAERKSLILSRRLSKETDYASEIIYSGNLGKRFKKAEKWGAAFCIIMGDDECESHTVNLKNMQSSDEKTVTYDELINRLETPSQTNE